MAFYVYVAGPLTKGDYVANVRNAIHFADTLFEYGFQPFVPHLSALWDLVTPRDYESWMLLDFAWLAKCDALFRVPGESPGADREVVEAERLGIPVFTSMAAILEWRNREVTK